MDHEGSGLIPADLVCGAAPGDTDAAERIAHLLLPALQELAAAQGKESDLTVRRTSTAGDVCSFRIDVANSPYYATITEHNVIERYSVERPRTAAGKRIEMRPVLVEITHIFTVHDAEGSLVSASEALRAAAPASLEPNVFSELFEAARDVSSEPTARVAG